jgi:hypothetical protein
VDWSLVVGHYVVVAVMIDKNISLICGKPRTLTAHLTFDMGSPIRQWAQKRACDRRINCVGENTLLSSYPIVLYNIFNFLDFGKYMLKYASLDIRLLYNRAEVQNVVLSQLYHHNYEIQHNYNFSGHRSNTTWRLK